MPPLPVVGASVAAPMSDATAMVRLALSAAQADGALGPEERQTVLARGEARPGWPTWSSRSCSSRGRSRRSSAASPIRRSGRRSYSLAFAVVRADEQVRRRRAYLSRAARQPARPGPGDGAAARGQRGAKIDARRIRKARAAGSRA
jgi:hypothetical protein